MALSQGFNAGTPIWSTFDGPQFRSEVDAHDIIYLRHTGWFTTVDGDFGEKTVGIVARLPHGRFLAGYRWTANDERVYWPEAFDREEDAARMADEHARVFAEEESEAAAQFDAARELEDRIDSAILRVRELFHLRHHSAHRYQVAQLLELVADIRDWRETLATDYADYL